MTKPKKKQTTKQRSTSAICIPHKDPENALTRLETIYAACKAGDVIYLDLRDKDSGEIIPVLAGVDDSTDPVRLIPLAKWLTAADVLNKAYEVWNSGTGEWLDIKETKLTKEAWHGLKFSEE